MTLNRFANYSHNEKLMCAIFAACSNFAILPLIVSSIKHRQLYYTFIASLVLLCSFCYHFCEPLHIKILDMNDGQWHKLDNIASISAIIAVLVSLMDNKNESHDEHLNYGGFMLVSYL